MQNITTTLATLRAEVEIRNSINLYDINIHAEYFYKELLNLIYDLKLGNLNARTTNNAYIDLFDEENKIAIQVTSQNDSGKIKKTIEGFFSNPENVEFNLKVLLIAKQAKNYKADFTFNGKYKFNTEKDVIDVDDIISEINDKNTHSIKIISEFLINEVNLPKTESKLLPSNIPSPKGFIGRENELNALQVAKSSGKTSFVLHGAGGVGKTDLALEFIKRNKADYQVNIRIDMQGLSSKPLTPSDAMIEIIRAFNPGTPADLSEKDIKSHYISLLNQHKTILFFDNAKDRDQVKSLNDSGTFIVVTSRTSFYIAGGLSTAVDQLSIEDARNLLYSIAEEKRFDGQADALSYLAGYLPMALLPLAALLADDVTLEAQDLLKKYSDRKTALKLVDINRENLSVEASFDLSYEVLSGELKKKWRKLAVFPADFDLEAMQVVWEIEDGKESQSALVQKHLLDYNSKSKRLYMHDLAKIYAFGKMSVEECFRAKCAHCVYYGHLLASLHNPDLKNLTSFDLERINIESGFDWSKSNIELVDFFARICSLYVFLHLEFCH